MKIEIIRHGDTEWMTHGKYQGISDIPLSEAGKEKLKKAPYNPQTVYVSSLTRARETAHCIFPNAEQIVIPDLNEMNFGIFEGRSAAEMNDDEQYRSWVDGMCLTRCPGGETKDEFTDRVCRSFCALLNDACDNLLKNQTGDLFKDSKQGTAPELVIVAHGGTAMAIMESFCDKKRPFYKWHLKSGCGYVVEAALWKEKKQLKLLTVSDHNKKS